VLELLATACAGLFAGAAMYVSVVQHPAALELGGAVAAAFFAPMDRRAAPVQSSLAVVGTLAALVAWMSGSGALWGLGALLLGAVVSLTLVRIQPIVDRLRAPGLDRGDPDVARLLRDWAKLHGVRSLLGVAAFAVFLAARS